MASGGVVCGVDEAGRGAVIGPMVVAGVALPESDLQLLESLGVRDSKRLSQRRREEIYWQILSHGVAYALEVIDPPTIDRYTRRRGGPGINALEAEAILKIAERLAPHKLIVDSPLIDAEPLRELLRSRLRGVEVICECHADANYPVVAAASIVAKVNRDKAISTLAQSLGEIGSGYPSDPKTREYVRNTIRSGAQRGELRMAWRTIDRLMPSLTDYL
jgi:ribonuclease HII